MDLHPLLAALADPACYPDHPARVELRQTHVSAVFLTDRFAYKVKKPVALGFLDFSTLDRRRSACAAEVRLNRRLAPAVYLGVVPICATPAGPRVEGDGEAIEWAVKMDRLPDAATLRHRLTEGSVDHSLLEALAERIAAFHARAERGEHVSRFGRFEVVAANAREALAGLHGPAGVRLRALTEAALADLRPLIAARAARHVPCDTHGDLRLDHVYHFPDRRPPADVVILDCVEFSDRFRFADPVADVAFLVMDLRFHGRDDLADAFADAYVRASGDEEGRGLLPFYTAYRAAVRAKVDRLTAKDPEVPAADRATAAARASAHRRLARRELAGTRSCETRGG